MDFIKVFKALGDETRLRLLNLFIQSNQKICVCEIVDSLLLPQYLISRHLTILRNVNLVNTTRDGTWIYYKANRDASKCVSDLFNVIKKHFKSKYSEDIKKLNERLALREDNYCVIGHSFFFEKSDKKNIPRKKTKRKDNISS